MFSRKIALLKFFAEYLQKWPKGFLFMEPEGLSKLSACLQTDESFPSRRSAQPEPPKCIAASRSSKEQPDHGEPAHRWNPIRVLEDAAPSSDSCVRVHWQWTESTKGSAFFTFTQPLCDAFLLSQHCHKQNHSKAKFWQMSVGTQHQARTNTRLSIHWRWSLSLLFFVSSCPSTSATTWLSKSSTTR